MNYVVATPAKASRFRRSDVRLSATPAAGEHNGSDQPGGPAVTAGGLHVLSHSIGEHTLSRLRSRHTPPEEFRGLSSRLLLLLMWEATRGLPTREEKIETCFIAHEGRSLARPVVFLTLGRHALGLAHDVAAELPGVHVGMITLDRPAGSQSIEARFHVNSMPLLDTASVILFDPVVASGASACTALRLLRRSGAGDLTFVSFVGSLPGLSDILTSFPDVNVWVGAVDSSCDAKRGPVPGIGDFAQRLYG